MICDNSISSKDSLFTMIRILAKQKSGLKIAHLNAQSLNNKLDEFKYIFVTSGVDVICVSETWFDSLVNDAIFNIPGFKLFRADRESHAGGVAIYVRNNINCCVKLRSRPSCQIEYLFLEMIMQDKKKVLLACVYRPNNSINTDDLLGQIESLSLLYNDVIITGDLNSNLLVDISFSVPMQTLGLLPVNTTMPTHYPNATNSLLDVFFVNHLRKVMFYEQLSAPVFSRHDLIFITYDAHTNIEDIQYTYRDFRNIDYNALCYHLDCVNWNLVYELENVNDQFNFIQKNIINIYNDTVPVRSKKIKVSQPPWFDKTIKRLIDIRDIAYKRWKHFKTPELQSIFKSARKDVTKSINAAKSKFYQQKFSTAIDSKSKWQIIREIGIGKRGSCIANSGVDVDKLNEKFVNIHIDSPEQNLYDELNIVPAETSFSFRCVNQLEVRKSLLSIKSNAEGLDGINPRFLKLIVPKLLPFLTHLFNTILTKSIFPDVWKKAKIIPIPKNNGEFRPIAILPCLSKAMENIMKNQINVYINERNLLTEKQSGFRQRRSCTTVLIDVVEELRSKLDNDMVSFLVLLDHSKAFDTVDHLTLLTKLQKLFNFSITAKKLVSNYLLNRKQVVFFNGLTSNAVDVNRGVPQGSILGPLLFGLYINDLPNILNFCSVQMYADDVQLCLSSKLENVSTCIAHLNDDLTRIHQWASANGLCLNPSKSKCIFLSRNGKKIPDNALLMLNNTKIDFVSSSSNLGVTFNEKLSWSNHINKTTGKVHGMLRNLWSVQASTPLKIRMLLAKTYLMPVLLYGCELFANCDTTDFGRLEVTYNNIARYVFDRNRGDSISSYSFKLNDMCFKDLLKYKSLIMLHKIICSKEPEYLYRRITFAKSPRGKNLISQKYKYLISTRQFFNFAISLWNNLPSRVQTQSNTSIFKKELIILFGNN